MILKRPPESRAPKRIIEKTKPEDVDSVIQLMKELRLSQMEAQKRLDEQMLLMRHVCTKSVAAIPQLMYVAPNQYGNWEYPLLKGGYKTNLKGCYWDGKLHVRDDYEELQSAISRREVHYKGKVLYLRPEGVRDSIWVPVPVEIDGKVT